MNVKAVNLLAAAVVLAVVAGAAWAATAIVGSRIRSLRQDRAAMLRTSADLRQARAYLVAVQSDAAAVREALPDLAERVPASGSIGSFVTDFDGLRAERGVELLGLEARPSVRNDTHSLLPIRLALSAPFADIHGLLHDIESMKRIVLPHDIVITGPTVAGGPCEVAMTVHCVERSDTPPEGEGN